MRSRGVGRSPLGVGAAIVALLVACLAAAAVALADEPAPAETTTTGTTTTTEGTDSAPASAEDNPSEDSAADTDASAGSDATGSTLLAAKAGSVTIADFSFSPSSITVSVGDSVTWTNQGPSDHTVTADNSSFDSGTIPDGGSFSHTFSQAGTFGYFCTFHDEMTGTVVVSGGGPGPGPTNDGGPGGTDEGGTTDTGGTTGTTGPLSESEAGALASDPNTLPSSGQDELPLVLIAAALLLTGAGVRRLSRGRV